MKFNLENTVQNEEGDFRFVNDLDGKPVDFSMPNITFTKEDITKLLGEMMKKGVSRDNALKDIRQKRRDAINSIARVQLEKEMDSERKLKRAA